MKLEQRGEGNQADWVLRPETPTEMRWLTILRDLTNGEPEFRLRVTGSQAGKESRGLPPEPVTALRLQGALPPKTVVDFPTDPNQAVFFDIKGQRPERALKQTRSISELNARVLKRKL